MHNPLDYLQNQVISSSNSEKYNIELSKLWFKEVCWFVYTVFNKVMKFNIEDKVSHIKTAKLDNQEDVHDYEKYKKYYACCVMNLWDAQHSEQKEIENELDKCLTTLDKKILISEHIWSKNAGIRPATPLIECEVDISCHNEPNRVHIQLTRISSYKKVFKSFAISIQSKLPQWFDVHEKEMNKIK
ncbi:hypothetical protein HHI36_010685 [Cryptolaemus montrouzieri]|uniref:Uncharacterized protein n=1 Tax=Cryptolaemus montrouzieri TaxID=559131 RepID=A0ABD2MJP2_9CUCU